MNDPLHRIFNAAGPVFDTAFRVLCVIVLAGIANGCAEDGPDFREVIRVDEVISDRDAAQFLRIVAALPEGSLSDLPSPFPPLPQWEDDRTLPVGELVDEDLKAIQSTDDVSRIAETLRSIPRLSRTLQRERMTIEQFAGLSLAIGTALSRSTLREEQDLARIMAEGEAIIDRLKQHSRPFHLHSPEGRHRMLRDAAWITRVARAKLLNRVPEENYTLMIARHAERLRKIFPPAYTQNPLDAVADLESERGTPFEDGPLAEDDADITWDPHEAIVGTDTADDHAAVESTSL